MRRMEEEVTEYVGPREDFMLSEDDEDHSPTDASEDSVEVKVTPIKSHFYRSHLHPLTSPRPPAASNSNSSHNNNLPLPLKVATAAAHHQHPLSPPPANKFYHNFLKHFPAGALASTSVSVVLKDEHHQDLKARRSPEDFDDVEGHHHLHHLHHHHRHRHQSSPQDYSRSRSRGSSQYDTEILKSLPQDFSTSSTTTTIVRGCSSSPGAASPPVPSEGDNVRPSPPATPVEPPMGAAPLSPGTRAAARSRRKPAEPRRLCHETNHHHHNNNNNNNNNNNKRSHSPDHPATHKQSKCARTDGGNGASDDKSVGSSPSPGAPPILAHHPLLGPLGRPPMGAFPPLLLPPAWPPVAAQWGYPRVVTPLGWAGLTPGLTPHPYPMLLPHHYPLARPLLHPHHLHSTTTTSPPLPKSPPPRPPSDERRPQQTHPPQPPSSEDLPIPLVTRVPPPDPPPSTSSNSSSSTSSTTTHHHHHHLHQPHLHPHHRHHPHASSTSPREVSVVKKIGKAPSKFLSVESLIASDNSSSTRSEKAAAAAVTLTAVPSASTSASPDADDDAQSTSLAGGLDDDDTIHSLLQPNKQKQRNYKNMTRERRIEANARERNRVHTISAAFEKLRTSVPAYSHNQKLSKLSVLRIACSYILCLSRLAGHDYSEGATEPSFSECVDLTTRTIQVEGKAKKKRDE